ncbi:MAG: hypothetical protein DRO36_04295 [Candidatus Hecatellales archaeon]|nr:MAG: hypothetical protein DRO36_04295 [Candidatus Hecatellales archaeon]
MSRRKIRQDGKTSQETLLRLIALCEMVEKRGINPFEVEVAEALKTIRQMLLKWKSFEEFCLDAEAINRLSRVVKLQEEWVKHRSSTLYSDPELVKSKIEKLSKETLAKIFLKSWRPIISLEKVSAEKLKEALNYWVNLPAERFKLEATPIKPENLEEASKEELLRLKLLAEEEFMEILKNFWFELLDESGGEKISYWDFIYSESYEEFIVRAYLTSFLVSYGYADLELEAMENKIFLLPRKEPKKPSQKDSLSIAIPLNYKKWLELKGGRLKKGG